MPTLLESIFSQIDLTALIDIGITALLIYWLFSLIRGTRAVSLVIGVSVLFAVYAAARAFDLRLLTQILQTLAVVGLFALVVVFQPELRRALERVGRVGLVQLALLVDRRPDRRPRRRRGRPGGDAALRGRLRRADRASSARPGLEEVAETGVMVHADLSADLLRTIFMPQDAAPRRRGDHPRRRDPRGRRAPAARRDDHPHRAVRDAPPGGARDHRADRRGRRSSCPRRTARSASSNGPGSSAT